MNKQGRARKGFTSEKRYCDACVPRVGGVPTIDGTAAKQKHGSRLVCTKCGNYFSDCWHIPYIAPVQHELPRADVVFGEHRARISGKRVG